VLTWFGVKFCLVADRAASALQEKVCAFTAGKFGLGAEITCHLNVLLSSAAITAGAFGVNLTAVGLIKNV
jgi:hypothetical protein